MARMTGQLLPHREVEAASNDRPDSTTIRTPGEPHLMLYTSTSMLAHKNDHPYIYQQIHSLVAAFTPTNCRGSPRSNFPPPPRPESF